MKKEGTYRGNPLRPEAFKTEPEMDRFEDFQEKAAKMMYETDTILLEKWKKDVKQKRSIEPKAPLQEGVKTSEQLQTYRPKQPTQEIQERPLH